ncbi:MAG: polysaccharide biosynthesis C-terminal domain-containing protein, partial [Clostridia bacterium]|nr:polysaccharide biosynthesis C-terminal domain-containing protein [Clostridia bacterium]
IAGVTLGHLLGLGFLTVFKFVSKPKPVENEIAESYGYKKLIRTLFGIAIPITFSSIALGLTANIDTFTIMNCLKSPDAMAKYGDYTTLAVTLFRLPQAFILPISAALTPTLSAAISAKNAEKAHSVITSSLKLTSVIAVPCMFGMSVLSYPIIYLLFGNGNSEKSIAETAPLLSILSVGIVFMALLTVTSSVLQAHKLEKKPVIAAFLGALTKLVLNIILVSTVGMIGAPISSVVGYFVMAAVNFYFVIKYVAKDLKISKTIGKVVISSLIMAVFALGVYLILYNFTSSPKISVVVAVPLAAIFYVFMLLITKSVEKDDILMMPKGEKVYSFLKKMKFIK